MEALLVIECGALALYAIITVLILYGKRKPSLKSVKGCVLTGAFLIMFIAGAEFARICDLLMYETPYKVDSALILCLVGAVSALMLGGSEIRNLQKAKARLVAEKEPRPQQKVKGKRFQNPRLDCDCYGHDMGCEMQNIDRDYACPLYQDDTDENWR